MSRSATFTFKDGGFQLLSVQTLCAGCGNPIDETKPITKVPGATLEEEANAEVIRYSREFDEFADWGYWHGDCWRAELLNMPQDTDMPEPQQYLLPFLGEGNDVDESEDGEGMD